MRKYLRLKKMGIPKSLSNLLNCTLSIPPISYSLHSSSSLPEMAALNLSPLFKTLNPQISHSQNPPKTPTLLSLSYPLPSTFPSLIPCTLTHQSPSRLPPLRAIGDGEYSARRTGNEDRETIMLPGCDYNHWLIVMEFPKDPAPTREQMIDTYLDTLATVLGSMEEAKKNMYAFSTTTYTGFQCTVSEETSEKFKGLPGVLWVLPDSYIDVKNKDYGGDKYINGEIIPCQYPTYQPKQYNRPKSKSKAYVRRRDGPAPAPAPAPERRRQEATPESSS